MASKKNNYETGNCYMGMKESCKKINKPVDQNNYTKSLTNEETFSWPEENENEIEKVSFLKRIFKRKKHQ